MLQELKKYFATEVVVVVVAEATAITAGSSSGYTEPLWTDPGL